MKRNWKTGKKCKIKVHCYLLNLLGNYEKMQRIQCLLVFGKKIKYIAKIHKQKDLSSKYIAI